MKVTMKATRTIKRTHKMKATHQTTPKINEYPSYPDTSGRMGATANDSPHRNRFFVVVDCCMCFLLRELFFGVGGCVVGGFLLLSTQGT